MDIVMGGFVSKYLADMNDKEMDHLEEMMEVPDQILYQALLKKNIENVSHVDNKLFMKIADYLHDNKRK